MSRSVYVTYQDHTPQPSVECFSLLKFRYGLVELDEKKAIKNEQKKC